MIFRRIEPSHALSFLALLAACNGTSLNNVASGGTSSSSGGATTTTTGIGGIGGTSIPSTGGASSASSGGATTQAMGGSSTQATGGTFSGGATSSSAGQSGSGGTTVASSGASCDGSALSLQAVWPLPTAIAWSYPFTIAVDGQGNLYVAGSFNGTVTFGSTVLTSSGPEDMFLAKYDATGAPVFAKNYGGPSFDQSSPALAVDDEGNAYLGGEFGQRLDFGDGTTPLEAMTSDGFVAKIGPTGKSLWAQRFGWAGETWVSHGGCMVYSIAIAPGGDPVVAGTSGGVITLGSTNWAPAGLNAQPFVARLKSADGSVVWGAASRGTFDTDRTMVVVDAQNHTFVAGRASGGGGDWGTGTGTFRVGFDPSGKALWSRFDSAFLDGIVVDAAGRLVVLEDLLAPSAPVTIQGKTFSAVSSALVMLFSPVDGSLISGAQILEAAPWTVGVDPRGNSFVTGYYWTSLTWGTGTLPRSGNLPMFLAAVDGTSKPAGLAGLGTTTGAQPLGIAIDRTGRIFVAATMNAATTTSVGPISTGPFIAVFGPDPCVTGVGPIGATTGDASNHGDLPATPFTLPDPGPPGPCPASSGQVQDGAACPVKRGCAYGSECCICIPTPCGSQPTHWYCSVLPTSDPACPTSAPADGDACSTSNLHCEYCTIVGHQFATCTVAGWQSEYVETSCH